MSPPHRAAARQLRPPGELQPPARHPSGTESPRRTGRSFSPCAPAAFPVAEFVPGPGRFSVNRARVPLTAPRPPPAPRQPHPSRNPSRPASAARRSRCSRGRRRRAREPPCRSRSRPAVRTRPVSVRSPAGQSGAQTLAWQPIGRRGGTGLRASPETAARGRPRLSGGCGTGSGSDSARREIPRAGQEAGACVARRGQPSRGLRVPGSQSREAPPLALPHLSRTIPHHPAPSRAQEGGSPQPLERPHDTLLFTPFCLPRLFLPIS